ncbi:hypothetical protein G6F54_014025 [Rhizopus delemar]|nr:hypothetical protein G6F54_014025 [Rhizopus delemar]
MVVQRAAAGQGVRHFAKACLDGLFVLRDLDVLLYLRQVQAGQQRATREDRHGDLGHEAPGARTTFEQAAQAGAGGARLAGQADGREERRPCRADIGVRTL